MALAPPLVLREVPLHGFDERTLLGDGHRGAGQLWYRAATWNSSEAGFVVVDGPKIVKLGVLPAFRRRGVGAALVREALARVRGATRRRV